MQRSLKRTSLVFVLCFSQKFRNKDLTFLTEMMHVLYIANVLDGWIPIGSGMSETHFNGTCEQMRLSFTHAILKQKHLQATAVCANRAHVSSRVFYYVGGKSSPSSPHSTFLLCRCLRYWPSHSLLLPKYPNSQQNHLQCSSTAFAGACENHSIPALTEQVPKQDVSRSNVSLPTVSQSIAAGKIEN